MLSLAETEQFRRDGYLVIPGFFEPGALLKRTAELLSSGTGTIQKFSTGVCDLTKDNTGQEYFLSSGDKISYFYEAAALDASGRLVDSNGINKIGHGITG